MKYGGDGELCAEPGRIATECEECVGCAGEEHVEEEAAMRDGNRAERSGEREDDVEVMGGQDPPLATVDPLGLADRLALWTMAIAAGVVGRASRSACLAQVEVSSELGRATAEEITEELELLGTKRVSAGERIARETHHVRHLVGGAAGRCVGWTLRVEKHGYPRRWARCVPIASMGG